MAEIQTTAWARPKLAATPTQELPVPDIVRRPAPEGFLWGTAISAHQSEGNNVGSDAWLCENVPATLYREPSRDACDSYNRFGEDIAIAAYAGAAPGPSPLILA